MSKQKLGMSLSLSRTSINTILYIQHFFHCVLCLKPVPCTSFFSSLHFGGFGYDTQSNTEKPTKITRCTFIASLWGFSLAVGNTKRGTAINIVRTVAHQINSNVTACLCYLAN